MHSFSPSAGKATPDVRRGMGKSNRKRLRKQTGRAIFSALAVALIGTSLLYGQVVQVKPVRRVLIIYELGLSSPAVAVLDQQIRAALEHSPFQIELYREYMETTLFPDAASQQEFRESYLHKYRNRKPDLIVALGNSPLQFVIDAHKTAFSGVPVVFGGTDEKLSGYPKLDSYFTGVWERFEADKALDTALGLQPATRHVVVVGGTSKYDRYLESLFREKLHAYENNKVDITYLTELGMPTLLESLKHLPENTVVLQTHIGQDAAGNHFVGAAQADPLIAHAANAPVYSPSDVDIGHGEVGGELFSFAEEGKTIGQMTVRLLSGTTPQKIPIVNGANTYIFDWKALKRWGLDEKKLPPGSIVLNRQPTAWEAYKWYIIGAFSLVILEAALIYGLLWQMRRRRKAETELALTYDRLRLAVEAGKCVGWDWDLTTGTDRWFGDLQTVFAIPSDEFFGKAEDFRRRVHPEDQQSVSNAVAEAQKTRSPYVAEFRVIREDQMVRWVSARGQFYYGANGRPVRMLGMALDITERKHAEKKLQESEERFRLVADTAPVLIWMSGLDKRCYYFNQPWLRFTGRTLEAELGNGWTEGVHPDDVESCLHTYTSAFDQHANFEMQYRLRRYDGQFRWMLDTGVPRFNPDGSFAGYIGSCIDVTDRKTAEEALSNLSGRLIEAQEEERRRIAREIHDDYNQRLAMLAIDLEALKETSPIETGTRLHDLWNRVGELGADLHSLSHRLHSSTLERLGLVAGVGAFCQEFSEQQGIHIHFVHDKLPNNIPEDDALCLFRVAQEALRNVKRHSGGEKAIVRLEVTGETLHLVVLDQGKGFDLSQADEGGIGIRSMEERLRILGGKFEIHSRPKEGTRVDAWLPLQQAASQRAS